MRIIIVCLAFFTAAITATGCHSFGPDGKAYFWAVNEHKDPRVLFIDGKNAGILPRIGEMKNAEKEEMIKKNALLVKLPSGEYNLELRNQAGEFLYKGTLKTEKSGNSETVSVSWDKDADCKVIVSYF